MTERWFEQPKAAEIVEHSDGGITFLVDDVEPKGESLPRRDAKTSIQDLVEDDGLLAYSHEDREFVGVPGLNPFVEAVRLAFDEHRPLLLRPDDIWLIIAQGFAAHVNLNAEKLRERFVRHEGRKTLKIEVGKSFPGPGEWPLIVEGFCESLAEELGPGIPRLMSCDFTTSTPETRLAGRVALMDAFQKYFDYLLVAICGIPKITLLGTPADWKSIRERVDVIAEYELEWWTSRLVPICDALVETSEGRPSLRFWKDIYKPEDAYGGEVVTGWVGELFPYLRSSSSTEPKKRNPLLDIPRERIGKEQHRDYGQIDGIRNDAFPLGLSKSPIRVVNDRGEQKVEVLAGFVGVFHDDKSTALSPEVGWAVTRCAVMERVIETLSEVFIPDEAVAEGMLVESLPAELVELLERFGPGVFWKGTDHPWRFIASKKAFVVVDVRGQEQQRSACFDLDDGRTIVQWEAFKQGSVIDWWFVVGRTIPNVVEYGGISFGDRRLRLDDESTKIIAKGPTRLFEQMIDANGAYFFDAPDFVTDGSIEELLKL